MPIALMTAKLVRPHGSTAGTLSSPGRTISTTCRTVILSFAFLEFNRLDSPVPAINLTAVTDSMTIQILQDLEKFQNTFRKEENHFRCLEMHGMLLLPDAFWSAACACCTQRRADSPGRWQDHQCTCTNAFTLPVGPAHVDRLQAPSCLKAEPSAPHAFCPLDWCCLHGRYEHL